MLKRKEGSVNKKRHRVWGLQLRGNSPKLELELGCDVGYIKSPSSQESQEFNPTSLPYGTRAHYLPFFTPFVSIPIDHLVPSILVRPLYVLSLEQLWLRLLSRARRKCQLMVGFPLVLMFHPVFNSADHSSAGTGVVQLDPWYAKSPYAQFCICLTKFQAGTILRAPS